MAMSFYDLSVPTFLQTIRAVGGFFDRAAEHCVEAGVDRNDLVHARLFNEMAPLNFRSKRLGSMPYGGWKPRRPACSLRLRWSDASRSLTCRP